MDLYVVRQMYQNPVSRNGLVQYAAVEADTTRRAGEAIEFLARGLVRGVKALVLRVVALFRGENTIPVRVAARQQRVDLDARNDDRAAA